MGKLYKATVSIWGEENPNGYRGMPVHHFSVLLCVENLVREADS